jgi:membrane-bound metal-dependent hydrolase YbcI (DUF457 family)
VPSPLAHGLAGIAAGWSVTPPAEGRRALVIQSTLLAALGAAPDLDLLIHRHRYETHSIGAAVIAGAVAALLRWPIAPTRMRIFWAAMLAWATHPLLDMLAPDHLPPIGVMAFWPFNRGFYLTGWEVFLPIAREWQVPATIALDAHAAVRELLIMVPIVAGVWWVRTRRRKSRGRSSDPVAPRSPSA